MIYFIAMSDSVLKTVELDGLSMDYACFGEGEKNLVVIPGLAIKSPVRSASALEGPYKIFREKYTLYFFDRKKNAEKGYSLESMAKDQAMVMKKLGLERASVLGVSQGGMIAQLMAIHYPEVVGKLVLASSTSKAEPLQLETIGKWARLARTHDASGLVSNFIDDCFSEKFAARYRRALMTMYKDVSVEEMERFAVFADACDEVNTYGDLGKIKCPTLVLGAGADRVVTPEAAVKLAEKLKAENVPCEFYMYEGCGHAVFDELKEYKERIFNFLER